MPVLFVALMLIGGGLAFTPLEIPYSDIFMNLSVLILGVVLALGVRVSSSTAVLAVANLAVLNGYAHAYDMLLDVDAIAYTVGFALATLMLIAIGLLTKYGFDRCEFKKLGRLMIKPLA